MRTYSELLKFDTFEDRFNYLKLDGSVGETTFGFDRYLNQKFYSNDPRWKSVRNKVIIRDNGCDLGIEGYDLHKIYVHHMNPATLDEFVNNIDILLDPEYLICCSFATHQALHYGSLDNLNYKVIERKPNDTCPWRVNNE